MFKGKRATVATERGRRKEGNKGRTDALNARGYHRPSHSSTPIKKQPIRPSSKQHTRTFSAYVATLKTSMVAGAIFNMLSDSTVATAACIVYPLY